VHSVPEKAPRSPVTYEIPVGSTFRMCIPFQRRRREAGRTYELKDKTFVHSKNGGCLATEVLRRPLFIVILNKPVIACFASEKPDQCNVAAAAAAT
jgi:hypothetical protein